MGGVDGRRVGDAALVLSVPLSSVLKRQVDAAVVERETWETAMREALVSEAISVEEISLTAEALNGRRILGVTTDRLVTSPELWGTLNSIVAEHFPEDPPDFELRTR